MSSSEPGDTFLLSQVEQIGEAITRTFGEDFCEVLILDFRQPEHSIVWIRGQATRRHVGGAMSQVGVEMMAQGDEAQPRLNYLTRTPDGTLLKSSIVPLRDSHGHVFGALCIKLDVTGLLALQQNLGRFLALEETPLIQNVRFSDSIGDVAQAMIDETQRQLGMPQPPRDASQRTLLIGNLKQRGFFSIRRAVPFLADYLRVSRASIYQYLKETSAQQAGERSQDDE